MTQAQGEEKLIGRREGQIGHLIFNNPAKLNAVSLDMWAKACTVLEDFAKDPDIRAVVVSGTGGRAFVSGADISKFESERASEAAAAKYNATSLKAYDALYNFSKPTLARITGYCIGGGMNLAACCDLRFCNEAATFGIPAAKLGLGYGYAPIRRAAEIIGLSRTLEMIYTARQFSASEAYDIGLVNRICTDAALEAAVADTCAMICANAPLTIGLAKAAAREIGKPDAIRELDRLATMTKACFDSADYAEGRRAFMEKRAPNFKGQ
jgi:enoyl-CoA hydratase